jgi:hypothetical protein
MTFVKKAIKHFHCDMLDLYEYNNSTVLQLAGRNTSYYYQVLVLEYDSRNQYRVVLKQQYRVIAITIVSKQRGQACAIRIQIQINHKHKWLAVLTVTSKY